MNQLSSGYQHTQPFDALQQLRTPNEAGLKVLPTKAKRSLSSRGHQSEMAVCRLYRHGSIMVRQHTLTHTAQWRIMYHDGG